MDEAATPNRPDAVCFLHGISCRVIAAIGEEPK